MAMIFTTLHGVIKNTLHLVYISHMHVCSIMCTKLAMGYQGYTVAKHSLIQLPHQTLKHFISIVLHFKQKNKIIIFQNLAG